MRAIRTDAMTDEEIKRFAMLSANYQTEEEVVRHLNRIKDKLFATKARFDYYFSKSHRNPPYMEKALAEIPTVIGRLRI